MTRINFSVVIAISQDIPKSFVVSSLKSHKTQENATSLLDKIQRAFKLQLIMLMQTQGIKDQNYSLKNNFSNLSSS